MSLIEMLPSDAPLVPFSAGKVIFAQGAPGDIMYIVVDGQAEITLNGTVLETVVRGGVLGEMALIDFRPRSAAAVAKTQCLLLPIDEERFNNLVKNRPEFALHIMRVLVGRLRRMDGRK
jgi:CRP/FNR family transcriptional regulator, cyclic AMP receptor protein